MSVTSTWTAIASPPASAIRFAVLPPRPRLRSATATRNPLAPRVSRDALADPLGTAGDECDAIAHDLFLICSMICQRQVRAVGVRFPLDRAGDDGVAGQLAPEDAAAPRGRRRSSPADRDPGGHAHLLEHADRSSEAMLPVEPAGTGHPPSSPKLDSKLVQPASSAANALASPWPRVLWKCAVTSTPGSRSIAAVKNSPT